LEPYDRLQEPFVHEIKGDRRQRSPLAGRDDAGRRRIAFAAFKTVRDHVVFTNKRVIAINIQGMTGKKKDYTSLPYSKVQAFSVETAGVMDLDSELELWFSSVGSVRFEFKSRFDILSFNKLISSYIL